MNGIVDSTKGDPVLVSSILQPYVHDQLNHLYNYDTSSLLSGKPDSTPEIKDLQVLLMSP